MMKRGREGDLDTLTTMANYLVLLSRGGSGAGFQCASTGRPDRVFECKTCNRQFSSFQALGGHRASHKRSRVVMGGEPNHHIETTSSPEKPKVHECPICGVEFALGQALGGHMRRHRAAVDEKEPPELSLSLPRVTVVKKSSSINRTVLCLDLNLSPGENGLEFQMEKVAPPMLHCYL
ncbi:zinc finger protein ZAT12-like [Rhododendron vialii]|uniref:zinc finger protein ZAT12-like n=1 Tax=Rhododendron vialii TaxID=182163 RepID=UPI00265E8804|nr:zinc finger protein ZAT12-like [Rhododendron vialii]